MRLKDVMRTPVLTIVPETPLQQAVTMMAQHRIGHLPVLVERLVVGMVTRQELRVVHALGTPCPPPPAATCPARLLASDVMQRHVVTMSPETDVDDAAHLLWEGRTTYVLVTRDQQLLGLVTSTDLLDFFLVLIEGQQPARYKRILVPTNFSTASIQAVYKALMLARCYQARLTLLHVMARLSAKLATDMEHISAELVTQILEDGHTESMRRLESLVPPGETVPVTYEVVGGEPALEIVKAAARHRADLVILGHGKQRGWWERFVPSLTRQVTRYVACPVLVVTEPAGYEFVHK
jgi:acetoin utilization protein AcuB